MRLQIAIDARERYSAPDRAVSIGEPSGIEPMHVVRIIPQAVEALMRALDQIEEMALPRAPMIVNLRKLREVIEQLNVADTKIKSARIVGEWEQDNIWGEMWSERRLDTNNPVARRILELDVKVVLALRYDLPDEALKLLFEASHILFDILRESEKGGAPDRRGLGSAAEPDRERGESEPELDESGSDRPAAAPPEPPKAKPARTEYVVWYATNRRPNDPSNASLGYSSERDSTVHYGRCRVFVPESHRIGSIGSNWWRRLITRQDDRLRLRAVSALAATDFWRKMASAVRRAKTRTGILFIHGYNVSFEGAALRAAQLGFDLGIPGPVAFFSWPSRARLLHYLVDGESIEASVDAIAGFLVDLAERSGAERIHVVAHSMGNRGMLGAVNRIGQLARDRPGLRFGQFVLAAADVDAEIFRRRCDPYRHLGQRTTLYVSARDRAVEAASWLYDYHRVGFLPPVVVLPGIDTVEVTNIDLSRLGHGYVAEARDVLKDIHSLLVRDEPPDRRFGLRESHTPAGDRFWKIGA